MTATLEQQLALISPNVRTALQYLASETGLAIPDNVGLARTEECTSVPHYVGNTLVFSDEAAARFTSGLRTAVAVPGKRTRRWTAHRVNWYTKTWGADTGSKQDSSVREQGNPGDGAYHYGLLSGMVLQMHNNPALAHQFEPLSMIEREEKCEYEFWSTLASGYAGLAFVHLSPGFGPGIARKRAQLIRNEVREEVKTDTCYVGHVALDYCSQAYLRNGIANLNDVLTMSSVRDIHALITQPHELLAVNAAKWTTE